MILSFVPKRLVVRLRGSTVNCVCVSVDNELCVYYTLISQCSLRKWQRCLILARGFFSMQSTLSECHVVFRRAPLTLRSAGHTGPSLHLNGVVQ